MFYKKPEDSTTYSDADMAYMLGLLLNNTALAMEDDEIAELLPRGAHEWLYRWRERFPTPD